MWRPAAITVWCVLLFAVLVSTGPFPLRALAAGLLFATLLWVLRVAWPGRWAGGRDVTTSPVTSRTAHQRNLRRQVNRGTSVDMVVDRFYRDTVVDRRRRLEAGQPAPVAHANRRGCPSCDSVMERDTLGRWYCPDCRHRGRMVHQPPPPPDVDRDLVVELYTAGYSSHAIAEVTGQPAAQVERWIETAPSTAAGQLHKEAG